MEGHSYKAIGWILLSLVVPQAMMSAVILIANQVPSWFPEGSGLMAFGLSLGTGVACLFRLPVPFAGRVVIAAIYVLPAAFLLIMYCVYLTGFLTGEWL